MPSMWRENVFRGLAVVAGKGRRWHICRTESTQCAASGGLLGVQLVWGLLVARLVWGLLGVQLQPGSPGSPAGVGAS